MSKAHPELIQIVGVQSSAEIGGSLQWRSSPDTQYPENSCTLPPADRLLLRSYRGVTIDGMKVAISLPDPVFAAAEKLAHRLRVSRSQLYAQAIEEYLGKRQDSLVTERLNAVYAAGQEPMDPALTAAQLRAIRDEAW